MVGLATPVFSLFPTEIKPSLSEISTFLHEIKASLSVIISSPPVINTSPCDNKVSLSENSTSPLRISMGLPVNSTFLCADMESFRLHRLIKSVFK